MVSGLKFASIDIGSNAMRLLFCRVLQNSESAKFIKESLIRMPLRLGEDAFTEGNISKENGEKLIQTIHAFRLLIDAYDPISYRACATSALRTSKNGQELVDQINQIADVGLKIISGEEEAKLIMANHIENHLNPKRDYLYIDVGGGSTEISFIINKVKAISKSFPIGSVRLLKEQVTSSNWSEMESWVKNNRSKVGRSIKAIGSGGNINKIFAISEIRTKNEIEYKIIKKVLENIEPYSVHDRITKLELRPDRADVITHAGKIYLSTMKWANTEKMIVPQSGLPDGIIHELYEEYNSN
ncbi:MAG: exopolyphosphatase [Candidatus Neomarinimicrobiota bacterium]|nr:exopolyphosphatase [Candidatus Neomarinimicrobiota bacterium]|tara:strand:+ start:515 stop:1411 length:897 start_codon:yes stop_codon:yes gene_type:complete